ncbi:hypothetical protein SUGI_0718010 [Cryptomeria japonica]|nr:hypothetical protein SUGI_0718010 [Cryptomeria japonica]
MESERVAKEVAVKLLEGTMRQEISFQCLYKKSSETMENMDKDSTEDDEFDHESKEFEENLLNDSEKEVVVSLKKVHFDNLESKSVKFIAREILVVQPL